MGPRRWPARTRGDVQVRLEVRCTREDYLTRELWLRATLPVCPLHGGVDCGLCPHGYYDRVEPEGCRIRRFLCPKAGVTFSLLPDFLCAKLSSTLGEVEQVVRYALQAGVPATARKMRPRSGIQGGEAWVRRRLYPVLAAVTVLCGLMPEELGGARPRRWDMLEAGLGTVRVLEALRGLAAGQVLQALIKPVGFRQGRVSRAPP